MKAMKKALALGLALAMVVTAVPVTNAQAATTGLPKNKTYAAGKSYTLKLTTPSSWKSVKTTWSEKDSEISLSSKKAKSVKVKAIKKGSAKVTAKVTFKKASKSYKKTYTCKVTVKKPSLTAADAAEVAVGSTVSVKVAKAWPTTAKVTYKSDKTDVATVDATTGEVTGVATGEATITTTLVCGTKTLTATTKVTVKTAIIEMTSLDVKAADTLVAKFAYPVKKDNTTLTLKRGTTSVAFKETWNADGTEVTVKTDAKMTTGTYELTATDKTDATITSSKTVTVEAQKATEIVILNDVALTGEKVTGSGDSLQAYVYYDVLDQYGESMRSSVSIDWSSSVKVANKNVASGMLTLERTDSKDFTYGEQIFITGVNTKTGLSVNKTLTVGAKQAVNSVVMAGFIKKGTTDILTALPKDFKDSAYYMLYNVVDQNGNDMKTGRFNAGVTIDDITFVSDSPLVIKEMTTAGAVVTINDHEYDTVLVSPGIKVEQGGEVNVTAIANKTGNKTVLNVPVNVSEVLKSFVIGTPSDIVADGESVELPFTATDSNGNNVTNFEIIAKQATFNKLQLTVSTGSLKLSQKDDGTAKLEFSDSAAPAWSDSQTTDGQDRVVSLTAIVVGGETNNQMLNIVDKARPTGVSGVNFKNAYVEGDTATIELFKTSASDSNAYISYVDQYGRPMSEGAVSAFFAASTAGQLKGTDFAGYEFGTMVTYTGNNNSTLAGAANLVSGSAKDVFLTSSSQTVVVTMGNKVLSTASGEGCKFAVTKKKSAEYTSLDRAKNYGYSVVDITKVQGLTVKDTGKIYAQTSNSAKDYLEKTGSVTSGAIMVTTIPATHKSSVIVEGTYAGKAVSIPNKYYSYTGKFLSGTGNAIDTASNLTCEDLYNFKATTDNYARKDAEDLLTVTVNEIYSNANGTVGDSISTKYSELKKTVLISDAAPEGTTLKASAEATVLHPAHTRITVDGSTKLNDDGDVLFTLLDQYGKPFSGLAYEVKDVTEAAAYADNNFAVASNATSSVAVSGAERTDTFTVVASYKKLNASIKVTVGADGEAFINTAGNSYLDTLVNGANGLEAQRQAGLQ